MWCDNKWEDYRLLDCSSGDKLEKWGKYTLVRPDPQVIWKTSRESKAWRSADASYKRSSTGGGKWSENKLPESWTVRYGELTFKVKPMGFKHTGIFPEQATNWDWFMELIRRAGRPVKVLNLFAYTGCATVCAAAAGASVCHVDAAKGMVATAKENLALSGLSDRPVRFIVDDCKKFIERELRRGNTYDAIIMDPPSYGRGPTGELWKIEENIDDFVALAAQLLSDKPLFFLLNSYTTGLNASTMKYIVDTRISDRYGVVSEADEIGIRVSGTNKVLPAGNSVRLCFGDR